MNDNNIIGNDNANNNSHDVRNPHANGAGPPPYERRPSLRAQQNPEAAGDKPQGNPKKKKKKKHSKVFLIFKKLITVIMTTLLSLTLVMIITGTIVATALTVYVLDFMEETTGVTLQELEAGSDTYFYGIQENENGEEEYVVLNRVKTDVQRIPVTIDEIPQHVRDAFVYTEDERFYSHDGVDYKRTFSAFLNMFIHIYDTEQGGSTITQQLVKNLTGDNEQSPQRKIREIFRAMQLEKKYSKDEILEEYLNYIGFGGPINGIQLASLTYFGKDVSELTTAEAATLAAIPKSPNYYGPNVKTYDDETGELLVDGRANNKERQQYVLWQIYKNGAITYDEYQQYLAEKLIYTDSEEYLALHPEEAAQELIKEHEAYSWVVDAMYYETADYLCGLYNIDRSEAYKRINSGGYKIYATVDLEMQEYVENKFLDLNNLMSADSVRKWADIDGDGESEEYTPHVGFIAMDYDGSILALVGDIGKKETSLSTTFAVGEKRQIGSTMKPISTYGLALETDMIHWGSVYKDEAIMEIDGRKWPTNYSTTGNVSISGQNINIYYALQKSYNTIPAQLCEALTPKSVYNFCTTQMGMELDPADEAYSPLSVGSLTYGITLENLVNAYIPYGNNGIYSEAHIVSKIEQANHDVVYENNGNPRQAVSEETAWVMNRLLKNVVENGTGTAAKLDNKVVCGKTGTTDNWYDLTFVGLTRDFVSGITIGYKYYNESLTLPSSLKSAQVWYNAIGEYANSIDSAKDFDPVESVIEAPMCKTSGLIAGASCPKGVTGYWKSTNCETCRGGHYVAPVTEASTEGVTDPAADPNAQPATQAPDPNAQTPAEPAPETPQQPAETPAPEQQQPAGGEAAAPAA
ncbi:MAG: transglycosylase domain-containing protein [Ruminococcus sp.]|nr:transglycosylase domain-containing protein [Ruminococcus sp.]